MSSEWEKNATPPPSAGRYEYDYNAPPVKGRYRCRILQAEPGKSESGNRKVVLYLGVDDPAGPEPGEKAGLRVAYHCAWEGSAEWRAYDLLRAVGLDQPDAAGKTQFKHPAQLKGRVIEATFVIEEFQGRLRSSVKKVHPLRLRAGEAPPTPPPPEPEVEVNTDEMPF